MTDKLTYNTWLQSKKVFVRSDLVTTTNQNVVAGWGCVAIANIKNGTVLFRVPRNACFALPADDSSDASSHDDSEDSNDPTTKDTQQRLALHFICHKESTEWAPFLNLLTPQILPWTLDDKLRQSLQGTELEYVVKQKLLRIQSEYKSIQQTWDDNIQGRECITYEEYIDACSIVASHANPWFGVSIVPFNTTLNWGKENVEFDVEECDENEAVVVGRAVQDITCGSEMFQSYGNSVAELLYRCGFSPQFDDNDEGANSNDSISLFVGDIVNVVEALLDPKISGDPEQVVLVGLPASTTVTDIESKIHVLQVAGAIDTSSWDGMEDYLTAELSSPSKEFVKWTKGQNQSTKSVVSGIKRQRDIDESKEVGLNDEERRRYDDGGISKLIGICLVLLIDKECWQRTSKVVDGILGSATNDDDVSNGQDIEDDDESRLDDIAASALISSLSNMTPEQSEKLQQRAYNIGMGGHDPWRAILSDLLVCNSEVFKWDMAVQAAKLVIQKRMNRLITGGDICKALRKTHLEQREVFDAIQSLRMVEKSLLTKSLDILDIPFR